MTEPATDTPDELTRRAAEFEAAWQIRAAEMEDRRERRFRRTQRQFWFLFAFLLFAFVLLAYRTESNSHDIRIGFWQECVDRQERIVQSNKGREALIQLVIANPERPVPLEQVPTVLNQLREGMLLPLEDCGVDPDE